MKSNSFWRFLVNPFTRIAGWQAFFIGIVTVLAAGTIGAMNNIWFDNMLEMRYGVSMSFWAGPILPLADIVILTLLTWIAGMIVAKGVRFIDILGTTTLSFAPMLLFVIIAILTKSHDFTIKMDPHPVAITGNSSALSLSILAMPIAIWRIALMYNAFKVSTGLSSQRRLIITLIIIIVVALFASKFVNYILIMEFFDPQLAV